MRSARKRNSLALAAIALLGAAGFYWQLSAQDGKSGEDKGPSKELAAVRKTADEFTAAFNRGDAKAVAAFWTQEGEMIGADGETIKGRAAIEKSYRDFFKENPKAKLEVHIANVRMLGKYTALEEGTLKLTTPADKEPNATRYSVLHVRDDEGWKMATVREWVADAAELVNLKDLEWLVGTWEAKGKDKEISMTYAWGPNQLTLQGTYRITKAGKVDSQGTQIIGKDPGRGIRSWVFDSSGTFGESTWANEEGRWVIEAEGTLPDGSEVTAVNILIPLGKDAFTWQSTSRTAVGTSLPDGSPVRVQRVKAGQ